jgi:outer membrane protein assembly factor BamA
VYRSKVRSASATSSGAASSSAISAGGGKNSRDFMLSFTEPYFLGRRMSAGFDIYRQTANFDNYETT